MLSPSLPVSLPCAAAIAALAVGLCAPLAPQATAAGAPSQWTPPVIQAADAAPRVLSAASRNPATSLQARMRRCMQGWSRATQMSRSEWRTTCQRVIRQQPGLFDPDPL